MGRHGHLRRCDDRRDGGTCGCRRAGRNPCVAVDRHGRAGWHRGRLLHAGLGGDAAPARRRSCTGSRHGGTPDHRSAGQLPSPAARRPHRCRGRLGRGSTGQLRNIRPHARPAHYSAGTFAPTGSDRKRRTAARTCGRRSGSVLARLAAAPAAVSHPHRCGCPSAGDLHLGAVAGSSPRVGRAGSRPDRRSSSTGRRACCPGDRLAQHEPAPRHGKLGGFVPCRYRHGELGALLHPTYGVDRRHDRGRRDRALRRPTSAHCSWHRRPSLTSPGCRPSWPWSKLSHSS